MRLLGAIGILFCIQLQRVFADTANNNVPGFVTWAKQTAYSSCNSGGGQGDKDQTMINACNAACTDGTATTNTWNSMCDTLGKTVKCANIPDTSNGEDNELFTEFTTCCGACDPTDTKCCAECPNPVMYFLYWAEHDCKTDVDACDSQEDLKDFTPECNNAKPVSITDAGESTQWDAMCTTLKEKVGCSGLQKQDENPYSDFNSCCEKCEKKKDGQNDPTPTQQMTCCAATCCADCPPVTPPTTVATVPTNENKTTTPAEHKQTTAAPVTSAGKTTEDVSEATSTEQSTSIDTSAPLLPSYALWTKVIALSALIAQIL